MRKISRPAQNIQWHVCSKQHDEGATCSNHENNEMQEEENNENDAITSKPK